MTSVLVTPSVLARRLSTTASEWPPIPDGLLGHNQLTSPQHVGLPVGSCELEACVKGFLQDR